MTTEIRPLAFCQSGHRIAWVEVEDKQPAIHYWVAAAGLAMRAPEAADNGHYNFAPHEAIEPLETAQAGRREVMCQHGHGGEGEIDLADLLPVIRGKSSPLIVRV